MPRLPFNVRVVTPDKSWLVSLKVKEATPYTHGLYYGKLAMLDLLIPLGAISGPSSQLTLWQIPLLLLQSHQLSLVTPLWPWKLICVIFYVFLDSENAWLLLQNHSTMDRLSRYCGVLEWPHKTIQRISDSTYLNSWPTYFSKGVHSLNVSIPERNNLTDTSWVGARIYVDLLWKLVISPWPSLEMTTFPLLLATWGQPGWCTLWVAARQKGSSKFKFNSGAIFWFSL